MNGLYVLQSQRLLLKQMARPAKPFEDCYAPCPMSGCWIWTEGLAAMGPYGIKQFNGRCQMAHRVSWQRTYGEIPLGFDVLHHCDVPTCVNPNHLFLGKDKDNVADAIAKGRAPQFSKRTHCRNGHALSGYNLYIKPNGKRRCRECANAGDRRRRAAHG